MLLRVVRSCARSNKHFTPLRDNFASIAIHYCAWRIWTVASKWQLVVIWDYHAFMVQSSSSGVKSLSCYARKDLAADLRTER